MEECGILYILLCVFAAALFWSFFFLYINYFVDFLKITLHAYNICFQQHSLLFDDFFNVLML